MYYILKIVANILIFLTTRYNIKGKEKVPAQGPLLVVANHLSSTDPVIIGATLGRRVTFMAKEELFRSWPGSYFVRQFGAFPVYRGRSTRDALRQANLTLNEGKALGMFPEGKRSREASLMPAYYGSALIAYRNRVRILPVGIYGSETIWGMKWIWRRPKVNVVIGQPFCLPEDGKILSREKLAVYTEIIMKHIAELLPEGYKGEYAGWVSIDRHESKKS